MEDTAEMTKPDKGSEINSVRANKKRKTPIKESKECLAEAELMRRNDLII